MSQTIKDLISAIATGDAINTEVAFNAAMYEKISTKLDDMRMQVAQNMFNPVQEEIELAEDEIQLTEEEIDELCEKYIGFAKLSKQLKAKGAKNPEALAAWIGRKKLGKEKFQAKAAAGK